MTRNKCNEQFPICLYLINLKYNFCIGSTDSLNFHMALSKSQDLSIYNSSPVKMIIQYKWRKLAWIHQVLCFKYFAYLSALMVHANQYTSIVTIYILIYFFVFFTSIEILSFIADYRRNYRSVIYNLLDAIYLCVLSIYIYQYFTI